MKKLFCLILSLVLMLSLCGCSSEPVPGVTFKNNLDQTWDNLYISVETDEEWGDSVLENVLDPGKSVKIKMSSFSPDNAPGVFDIGVICHNNMNYDVYGVYLADGYEIEMSSTGNTESDTLTLIVRDTEGKVTSYTGYIYPNE